MDSALVIKVKYGDSLRRFYARVDENNQLDLDMGRLRAKILSLFNIPADANFTLRYVDEDGDLVSLLDDDDLHDVMSQHLKFLRIDVHVSNDDVGKSNVRSTGSATPLRSPAVPNEFLNGNVAIADALKPVLQPLVKDLSNLSLDFVSKAASSSPVVTTLSDCISKMGPSILNSDNQPPIAAGGSPKSDVPQETVTVVRKHLQYTSMESNPSASQQVNAGNVTRGLAAGVASVDLNIPPSEPCQSKSLKVNTIPLSSVVPDEDGKKGKTGDNFAVKDGVNGNSTNHVASDNFLTETAAIGPTPSLIAECPFSGTYITSSVAPSFGYPVHPLKRSHSHTEATGGVFHKGIRCDGCGVYPITGPRFKSIIKVNYDLCGICFNEMGNGTDYIRMDRPVSVRSQLPLEGAYGHHPSRTGAILKNARSKLDSQFTLDVSVIDGTIMAPSSAFTKIWRMRNTGISVWPKGTQLVWIEGCLLSDSYSVELKIPEGGVPADKELDIAVEMRAPELPGRYISYWTMAHPSGQRFGQRVWVIIKVEATLTDAFYAGFQGLNLNIPLDASDSRRPQVIDINVQPTVDDAFLRHLQSLNSPAPYEPVKQKVDKQPGQEPENNFPINESTSDGHTASSPATSVASSPVSYAVIDSCEAVVSSSVSHPIIDSSETAPVVPPNSKGQSMAMDAPSSSIGKGGNNSVEETLLKQLEEMGFKQVDLNREVLRMNEYDLEQSVDVLCGATE